MYYSEKNQYNLHLNRYPQPIMPYVPWESFAQPNQYLPYQVPYYDNKMMQPFTNQYPHQNQHLHQNQYPSFNQYPGEIPSIMAQFKTQDGKIDFNKMMNTAGQMVGTVNQISSLVKGISQTFKGV